MAHPKDIKSVEFISYVLLPPPHGRQSYVHKEKFTIEIGDVGVDVTCKATKQCTFVPWGHIRQVVFDEPAVKK